MPTPANYEQIEALRQEIEVRLSLLEEIVRYAAPYLPPGIVWPEGKPPERLKENG